MSLNVQVAKQKNKNTRLARGLVWFAGFVNVVLLLMLCAVASNPAGTALVIVSALVVDAAVAVYALSNGLLYEIMVVHKWKKTCQGLGGNFVGQGRAYYQTKVRLNYLDAFRDSEWKRKTIYPKLRDVQRKSDGSWTGVITPLYGQNIDDFIANGSRFKESYRVSTVQFERAERGLIAIRAGNVQVPQAYTYQEM